MQRERARAEERQAELARRTGNRRRRQGRSAKRPLPWPPSWRANSARAWTGWRRISPTPNPRRGRWRKERARRRRKRRGCGRRRRIFTTALPGWPNKRKSGGKSASAWHKRAKPTSFACNNFNSNWKRRAWNCTAWRRNPARSGRERDTLGPRVDAAQGGTRCPAPKALRGGGGAGARGIRLRPPLAAMPR